MAAVISDFVSDSSRFHHNHHTMIAGSGQQRSPAASQYRQRSRSRAEPPPSPRPEPVAQAGTPPPSTTARPTPQEPAEDAVDRTASVTTEPPSPPSSSSPVNEAYTTRQRFTSQENFPQSSAPFGRSPSSSHVPIDQRTRTAGSPSASYLPFSRSARSLDDVKNYGGNTIKVRNLAHIQSFATEEFLSYRGQSGRRQTAEDPTLKYEISGMPITDIIEMVAGLLTKITTTNDRQHDNLHQPLPSGDNSNLSGLSSSVLAFHGKNVPSITILSYLSRIHKYCPTTYEVFLSLLVYFDRMTERVNAAPMQSLGSESADRENSRPSTGYSAEGSDLADSPPSSRSVPEIRDELEKAQYTHASGRCYGIFPILYFLEITMFYMSWNNS